MRAFGAIEVNGRVCVLVLFQMHVSKRCDGGVIYKPRPPPIHPANCAYFMHFLAPSAHAVLLEYVPRLSYCQG